MFQVQVKIMQLWSYDEDADEAHPGENVKMKVAGVEEEVKYTQQTEKSLHVVNFCVISISTYTVKYL